MTWYRIKRSTCTVQPERVCLKCACITRTTLLAVTGFTFLYRVSGCSSIRNKYFIYDKFILDIIILNIFLVSTRCIIGCFFHQTEICKCVLQAQNFPKDHSTFFFGLKNISVSTLETFKKVIQWWDASLPIHLNRFSC